MNLVFGKPRGLLSREWVNFQIACATATGGRGMLQFPRAKGGRRGEAKRALRKAANEKVQARLAADLLLRYGDAEQKQWARRKIAQLRKPSFGD